MSKNSKGPISGWKSKIKIIRKIINMHNFLVGNAHSHAYNCKAAVNYLTDSPNRNIVLYFNHYHDMVEEYLASKLVTWEIERLNQLKKDLKVEIIRIIPLINFEFVRERLDRAIEENGFDPESEYDAYFRLLKFSSKFTMMLEEKILLNV